MKHKRGKYSRAISNTRRAINRLGGFSNKPHFSSVSITDIKTTPLYVEWTEDGSRMKAEYKDIASVTKDAQELRLRLQVSLSENQELEALHQLQTKGKVSRQFKKSVEGNYSILQETLQDFEERSGADPEATKRMFDGFVDIEEDATKLMDVCQDSDCLNQFYHEFGFRDMNILTVNLFRALRGDRSDEV
jgi:hypothetical protein